MKRFFFLLGTGLVSMLVGCSTTPVALAPVGPDPGGIGTTATAGTLQVFSRVVERSDDQNQGGNGVSDWRRYTGYDIYDLQGKRVRHVRNAIGYYAESPERITLAPGSYLVKAQAKGAFWVDVPVTIQRGRTTRVHLDNNWNPTADAPNREIVTMPDGQPVGWRAESANGN